MAAILEMPQYVAYQKNVVYALIKRSAKSHSLNILCTLDGLSCPTILINFNMVTVCQMKKAVAESDMDQNLWVLRQVDKLIQNIFFL